MHSNENNINDFEFYLYDKEVEMPFHLKNISKINENCLISYLENNEPKVYDSLSPIKFSKISLENETKLKFTIKFSFLLYLNYIFE